MRRACAARLATNERREREREREKERERERENCYLMTITGFVRISRVRVMRACKGVNNSRINNERNGVAHTGRCSEPLAAPQLNRCSGSTVIVDGDEVDARRFVLPPRGVRLAIL